MKETPAPTASAEFIAFEEFSNGLPHGRFRVIVNPALARPFIAQRLYAAQVAIAIIGCGIAAALAGYVLPGALAVGAGVAWRRLIRWQAPKLLLELASRQRATYYDATSQGVMEVQRA